MKKQKLLSKIFLTSMLLAIPACAGAGIELKTSHADTANENYSEIVSVSNNSFNSSTSVYSKNNVTGWSRIKADGSATTMILDTVKNFTTNQSSTYYLSGITPGDANSSEDDNKILMINSALSKDDTSRTAHEGYKSSSIDLQSNSYYRFQISIKTTSFDTSTAFGSIYLTGLKDKDGKSTTMSFEKITANEWTTYYLFLATGEEEQTVYLNLWLGTENINSCGVVFFDEIHVNRYSENLFKTLLNNSTHSNHDTEGSTTKYLNIGNNKKVLNTSASNFDFEASTATDDLPQWSIVNSSFTSTDAHAKVLNMQSKNYFETETGKTYPGNTLKDGNKQALVLWTDSATNITVESQPIEIKAHGSYKVSMLVKTNLEEGSFKIKAKETDTIKTNFSFLSDYKLHDAEGNEISSTSSDNYNNNYQTVEFYIQGHHLYDSEVKLQLCLGDDSTGALGFVVIDDITVETISSEDLPSDNLLSLLPTSSSATIANGMFNNISDDEDTIKYPIAPASWDITQEETDYTKAGIINTYSTYYASYSTEDWGSLANPALLPNAPQDETRPNNVFMFWNGAKSYQTLSNSSSWSISSGNYYDLNFQFKTYDGSLTVELENDEGITLFYDTYVEATGAWETYHAQIYTGEASHSVKLKISFGTEDNKQKGYAFIDQVQLSDSTEVIYKNASNKIDLSNLLLNLDARGEINSDISEHSAFTGELASGNYGKGGVIIGNGNEIFTDEKGNAIDKTQDLPNNVLVIRADENSTYKLTSKYSLNVEGSDDEAKYYILKFKALTNCLPLLEDMPEKDDDGNIIEYSYGLAVSLENFEEIKQLITNDGWTEYTIIYKSISSESSTISFSLIANRPDVYGIAYITDLSWEAGEESNFTAAETKSSYKKTLFTSTTSNEEEDAEEEEDDTDEDTTETSSSSSDNYSWLLIPSIITGIAVIIAIVGSILQKVKLGKLSFKKKKKENYDRKDKLVKEYDRRYISEEARKIKEKEIDKAEKTIEILTSEITTLDDEHKQYIEQARKDKGGKITKDIERQFKIYSSKKSKLTEKLQREKENLETIKSPEYILVLEKKVSNNLKKNK